MNRDRATEGNPNAPESSEFPHSNDEVRRVWNANAEWWDDEIGDGNDFQIELIEPATDRLLAVTPGETILDVACGAGRLARRFAKQGARVVAFDMSERFIERARKRTPADLARRIEYHVLDADDEPGLLALGERRFDAAVATMALMDMARIEPLMRSLRRLLKPTGRFVFSICHPCFQPPNAAKFAEMEDIETGYRIRRGIKLTTYLSPIAWRGVGIVGQPEPQQCFHRPLWALLGAAFREGFVLDGLEEPALAPADPARPAGLSWRDVREFPPVLVARMRAS